MNEDTKPYGPHSAEFAAALADLYGSEWVDDQIARTEDPTYLTERLGRLLSSAIDVSGLSVLDYGCGAGASTAVIARLGAKVTGIDPDEQSIPIAQMRVRELGLADRVDLQHVPNTCNLPFDDGTFDVVVCNGVIEHMKIAERPDCIREMWRVVKVGRHLFVCNSPNSWWPIDSHTTHLPLVPYMPLWLARKFAIRMGKAKPGCTIDDLLDHGIRGACYGQIARWLGRGTFDVVRIPGDIDRIFQASLKYKFDTPRRRLLKRVVRPGVSLLDRGVLKPLNLPTCVITPYLAICLRKRC